ncbi:MAG TPA: nucleoside-diphosphate kinase [Deltaproteobacteria bacterium]|nr:nucleoside-diphosphate kinase [Deltaproteobacteria bacterium]
MANAVLETDNKTNEEMDMEKKQLEQTLVLIKPDALKNSLTGYVLSQLSEFHTGLRFAGAKIVYVSRILAQEHYAEHIGKPFFASLQEYIRGEIHYPDNPMRRRVIAFVYQGEDAIQKIRNIAGPTNSHVARDTKPGSIRALGTVVTIKDETGKEIGDRLDNLVHASANLEDAEREIKLWFKPSDIPPLMRAYPTEVSTEYFYFKNDKLYTAYEPDSICFVAPGAIVWKSDLDALHLIAKGQPAPVSLASVVAKYTINHEVESE